MRSPFVRYCFWFIHSNSQKFNKICCLSKISVHSCHIHNSFIFLTFEIENWKLENFFLMSWWGLVKYKQIIQHIGSTFSKNLFQVFTKKKNTRIVHLHMHNLKIYFYKTCLIRIWRTVQRINSVDFTASYSTYNIQQHSNAFFEKKRCPRKEQKRWG